MGAIVVESAGAVVPARNTFKDPHSGLVSPISGQSRTPRSFNTAIRPDIGEAEAYKQALLRGEVGLQRPMGVNVRGADFITAIRSGPDTVSEIVCTDVKTSSVGRFAQPKTYLRGDWRQEAQDAVNRMKLILLQ